MIKRPDPTDAELVNDQLKLDLNLTEAEEESKECGESRFSDSEEQEEFLKGDKVTSEKLRAFLCGVPTKIQEKLKIKKKGDSLSPFTFFKKPDGQRFFTVPLGLEKSSDSIVANAIVLFAKRLGYSLIECSQEIDEIKESKESSLFFSSLLATLLSPQLSEMVMSFSTKTDSNQGITSAKIAILKSSAPNDIKPVLNTLLPDNVFVGKNKMELLTARLESIGIGADKNVSVALRSSFKQLLREFCDKEAGEGINISNWKVPLSKALEGLHRTKTKKVKGKGNEVVTLHPHKPSERIEVLYGGLDKFIERYEYKPFEEYNSLTAACKGGIPLNHFLEVRERLKSQIESMWRIVEKLSAPLTQNTKLLSKYMPKGSKNGLTKSILSDIVEELKESGSIKEILRLSPLSVVSKLDDDQAIKLRFVINKIEDLEFEETDLDKIDNADVNTSMRDFLNLFGLRKKISAAKKNKTKKNKKAKQVDSFSEDTPVLPLDEGEEELKEG